MREVAVTDGDKVEAVSYTHLSFCRILYVWQIEHFPLLCYDKKKKAGGTNEND